MRKLLLLAALVALTAAAAQAQTTAPATDASGVPLINRNAPTGNNALPTPAASASRRPALPPGQQADRQSQRLAQALGLSASQQAQVRQILFDQRESQLAARQQLQASGARRGLGRAMKASRAQADDQLRGVLSPDQYARYQQLLAQRKEQTQQRRQLGGAVPSSGPLDN